MKTYGKLVGVLIAAWFAVIFSAAALGVFRNQANRVGAAVGLAALAPLAWFAVWFAASEGFRKFALALDPRVLTGMQAFRVVGVIFVILEARGILPAVFAFPAGYGDIFIGLTAGFAAWKLANGAHRAGFIVWQTLGMADLVLAVGTGTLAGLISPGSTPMVAMTVPPLSLIPTFLVPLFFILHVICIAQARGWKAVSGEGRPFASVVPTA
jgi:hypothetical protein